MGGQEELMRRLLGATDVPTMLGRQWRRVNQQPLLDPHPSPSLARLEGSLVRHWLGARKVVMKATHHRISGAESVKSKPKCSHRVRKPMHSFLVEAAAGILKFW
ncbi:uncharacterized protein [Physcomitrium patens]|uniref:uncharacterized protein n=1 Tax=Physcomitrium patens TaxID=3218 RepID=UPI00024AAF97